MNLRLIRSFLMLLAIPGVASAANCVVSLSHYDERTPDYAGMQREGVDAIIHEATYPAFDYDSKYAARQNAAARAGMLWGAYHFANASDGRKQADHFLDFVAFKARGSSPSSGVLLILDAEQNTHYPGGTMPVQQSIRFIERVHERTGIYPGVYSNENWVRKLFNSSNLDAASRQTLSKCWLWIANYHVPPAATAPWARWSLWQYTGDGICGLPRSRYPTSVANMRNVERTAFPGDRAALRRFWSEHSWRPEGT
jgi:lysozyme